MTRLIEQHKQTIKNTECDLGKHVTTDGFMMIGKLR